MTLNIDRFKKDLDQLIIDGELLEYSMLIVIDEPGVMSALDNKFAKSKKTSKEKKKEKQNFLNKIPRFDQAYEAWYSEALVLLKQLLPDRLSDFIALYERPKGRKEILYSNYVIRDFLQRVTISRFGENIVGPDAALSQFQQQLSIVKAIKNRFESSLFEIQKIAQADLYDSEIEAARDLLRKKFIRASGVIAGVVLESHLLQVCKDHSITIRKKNPAISDLNELLKSNKVIKIEQWREISLYADIRNKCGHKKDTDPTESDVNTMLDGVNKILKLIS